MKKYLIVFILFFLANMTQAQRFKGALVGGFNLSQIDGDRLFGYNKIGFNAGGQVAAILSDRWQFSVEISYSQRGSSRTRIDDPSSIYDRISLNYVETPILIRFLDWKLHFTAGLSYNRLINYTVLNSFGEDISDLQNYRTDNVASVVGVTYFYNEHLGFDLRWSYSFLDLQAGINRGVRWNEKWLTVRTLYLF